MRPDVAAGFIVAKAAVYHGGRNGAYLAFFAKRLTLPTTLILTGD